MCIIIDANMAVDFSNGAEYTRPIADYIKRGGVLTLNPKLYGEYPKKIHPILSELSKSKKIIRFEDAELPKQIAKQLESDDPHIVDLVLQSKTTVVCTKDGNLTKDLTNPSIVKKPRCRVYQHEGAKGILNGCCV